MRLLRIATPGMSEYERKAMALDERMLGGSCQASTISLAGGRPGAHRDAVSAAHEGTWTSAHVYGSPDAAIPLIRKLRLRYIAPSPPTRRRIPWRIPQPAASSSPLAGVPEAVAPDYFRPVPGRIPHVTGQHTVGSCLPDRDQVGRICRETMIRLSRFREDVEWLVFDETPSAIEMEQIDVWVDPTSDPFDFDGGSAEAMASRIVTISARTPIAQLRTRQGAAGLLVPPNDPNELAHAILNVLFRPETTEKVRDSMEQAAPTFDPAIRAERLLEIYREIGQ